MKRSVLYLQPHLPLDALVDALLQISLFLNDPDQLLLQLFILSLESGLLVGLCGLMLELRL